ncbi:MAG: DUF2726 domain-containing protein [Chloroflexota bacterium]
MSNISNNLPYRIRQDYLSSSESAFFHVLTELTRGKFSVCPKVALTDLFFVARPNENVQHSNKLLRKNIDFLLIWQDSLKPAIAIELDHPKQIDHRPADGFMESLFASTGVPLIHVTVCDTYDIPRLMTQIRESLKNSFDISPEQNDFSPICPRCGITMVLRFGKEGPALGTKYYGCLNFPTCQEIVPIK